MRQTLSVDTRYPIVARGIRKNFGRIHALDGLDLAVHEGEVHGFLGPNGAGKSTTIRAILGQLRLSGGSLLLFGADPWRHAPALHRRLAYVPGDTVLWPGLTGGECIDLIGRLQGSQDPARRRELIERFELDPTRRASTYSKGNRQKVALIASLSTRADLLLLDEPTSGLDPIMEQRFIDTVRELSLQGRTVLLSSHIITEVEQLCDRVTIIRAGRTVITETLEALRSQAHVDISVTFPGPAPSADSLPLAERDVCDRSEDGRRLTLTVHPDRAPLVVGALTEHSPSAIRAAPASLESLFQTYYEGALR